MKRRIAVIVILCLMLSGCDSWMSGSYSSVTPHMQDSYSPGSSMDVTTYSQLRQVLTDAAASGSESIVIHFPGVTDSTLESYMEFAAQYLTTVDPIGAYAVENISYEVGTNAGKQAVAVKISYLRSRSEILRIRNKKDMREAVQTITEALEHCDAEIVMRVDDYEEMDLIQMIQDYVDGHPDTCMEMPQVVAVMYPERGRSRVVELRFSYQTSRESLRQMQQNVAPVFSSAELYVAGGGDVWQKYEQLYSFLMERDVYTLETSITPSYSLLQHGVGDSKAFATVYAAMCRRAGLDCQVVSGARAGEAWYWNVILQGDTYYYIDLLRCSQNGLFRARTQEEMNGYVWDYSLYKTATE